MIARPLNLGDGHDLDPTDTELQMIDPTEATAILGEHALVVEGFSLIAYDTEQFMSHFYHWWGEIIFGAWRVISTLSSTSTSPSFITRVLLPVWTTRTADPVHGTELRCPAHNWPEMEGSSWTQRGVHAGYLSIHKHREFGPMGGSSHAE
ncbi:hypothetical protein C0991_007706 [Blastosporella zonata]|nr:hypothetical protein C0991_007706 [Blastosporella zonata]